MLKNILLSVAGLVLAGCLYCLPGCEEPSGFTETKTNISTTQPASGGPADTTIDSTKKTYINRP